ncbi:MAG: cytochrome c biogenesis CcdA family protein [Actinomycetota bacterium]
MGPCAQRPHPLPIGGTPLGPLAVALVAGGLSTVNPCGFALLPAFLSLYVGIDEERLPSASSRTMQGLVVGAVVSGGFLAVFAVVGLPLALGAGVLTRAVPWLGVGIGLALALTGLAMVLGRKPSLALHSPVRLERNRSPKTMFLFGIGYGIASLGCTLPVFLAVIGASAATSGLSGSVAVFAGYGAGMAIVLMALSLAASMLRSGLARRLKGMLRHMGRIAGGFIGVTGAYLTYYWARVRFGDITTLADDPLVGSVERFASAIQRTATDQGRWILLAAGAVVIVMIAVVGARTSASDEPPL